MIKAIILIVLIYSGPATAEALSFQQLAAATTTPDFLEGSFNQRKYLKIIDAELISNGEFEYKRGEFIHWKTLQPIQSELLMTPDSINTGEDGQAVISADANGGAAVLGKILFSVLTAEWQNLSSYFELSGELIDGNWRVDLKPINSLVTQVISRVELKGASLLDEVILHEKDGDSTTIRFDNRTQ